MYYFFIMKTKEQELALLGLEEMNVSERNEVIGGVLYPIGPIDPFIYCCIDIPPMMIDNITSVY